MYEVVLKSFCLAFFVRFVPAWRLNNVSVQHNGGFLPGIILFKKNLNASKPSEHPSSGEKMSKG